MNDVKGSQRLPDSVYVEALQNHSSTDAAAEFLLQENSNFQTVSSKKEKKSAKAAAEQQGPRGKGSQKRSDSGKGPLGDRQREDRGEGFQDKRRTESKERGERSDKGDRSDRAD